MYGQQLEEVVHEGLCQIIREQMAQMLSVVAEGLVVVLGEMHVVMIENDVEIGILIVAGVISEYNVA